MDIERIANSVDTGESHTLLTIDEAVNLLINKTSKISSSFFGQSLALNDALKAFIDGKITVSALRESAESLVSAASDIDALISAIIDVPIASPAITQNHEIMPIHEFPYRLMAYRLIDAIREWTDNGNSEKMLDESSKFVNISHQIYKNIVVLESHVGSYFKVPMVESGEVDIPYSFDKLVLESVSTGAIAMRPAILGGERKSTDVFPAKKRRWYLQYVVQR